MTHISATTGSGISREELMEAIPAFLQSKHIHLHWVEKTPAGKGEYVLSAKIEINGNALLLSSHTNEMQIIGNWDQNSASHHTNARLVALERILTDPANEDTLISL